ncbi:RNA-guided endonuclease IscB [Orrella sp. 11846]|uniref:RNA-guided endonuclease IscB n=1 Tax=Orrella sp. 11846 TaxID=3409913 RepID=UPI003B599A73
MPCTEKRARLLLERGRARVHRRVPFVIRMIDRTQEDSVLQPLRLKIDHGSKRTGMALVQDKETIDTGTGEITRHAKVLNLMELQHRGNHISENLEQRRAKRRRRRTANLRHRAPRFNNRTKPKGWVAPSLQHRVDTTMAWVKRLQRWAPLTALSYEQVRFDMQKLQNPAITGIEYQQGTLFGYEVREYLLEKWKRSCAYCKAVDVPLEIEHIQPKSKGGSDRVSNLTLACRCCNQQKGNQPIEQFLANRPDVLERILAQAKAPLRDAAAVNTTRNALADVLTRTCLPLELTTGGQTKFNRRKLGIAKTHALDAACVGTVSAVTHIHRPTLLIQCTGRGSYQTTRLTRHGFPRGYLMRQKQVHGFQTGDRVRAVVPSGKKAGTHIGRVAVRQTGNFNIQTQAGIIQGISHKYCQLLQRSDGYGYHLIAQHKTEEARDRVA